MHIREQIPLPLPALAIFCGALGGVLLVLVATKLSALLALMLVGGLLLATVILLYPALGFLLVAFVIPLERFGRFTDDASMYTLSLMRIIGLLVLVSFVLHALVKKRRFDFGPPFYLYFAYCGFGILTIFYTTDLLGNVRASGAILGNLLFFFLVVNMGRDWNLARTAVLVWLTSTVLIGAYTMYDWYFGQSFGEAQLGITERRFSTVLADTSEWESLDVVRRAVGPTSHAAVYGINLILTLPFFAFLFRTRTSWKVKAAVALGSVIVLYNIFLTNTRSVILLTVIVALMLVLRRMVTVTPARVVAVLLVGMAMLPFVPDDVYDRVLKASNYTPTGSATLRMRLEYWKAGLDVAEEKWLTGIGVGNQETIPRHVKGQVPDTTTVHNEYLQTFIEVGLIGWLIFHSFVGLILWYSFKAAATFRIFQATREQYWFAVACQIAMVAVLIYGVLMDVFHFPLKGWWLIAGLSYVMYKLASTVVIQVQQKRQTREMTA